MLLVHLVILLSLCSGHLCLSFSCESIAFAFLREKNVQIIIVIIIIKIIIIIYICFFFFFIMADIVT